MLQSFAGGRLFGARTGDAPPRVLALHGWARSHRDFDALCAGTGPTLDAVALDLPGFGASPPPPEAWDSAGYGAAVAPVLDEMAVPVVVVGHSFGGLVAVRLAAARPDAVRGLVLAGVPRLVRRAGPPPRSPWRYSTVRTLRRLGLVSVARLEAARGRYGSEDYRRAEGVMRQVLVRSLGESLEEPLGRVRCPVELVWGDDDTAAPISGARAAQALLGDAAHLTVCPGAGHLVPLTAPDALRQAVERRLR